MGATYRAIAATISRELDLPKYDQSQAYDDVQNILKELREQTTLNAQEYVRLELERLDVMQLALSNQVRKGDVNAAHAWLKIMERRAKYLGLDSIPVETATTLIKIFEATLPDDSDTPDGPTN